MLFNGFARRLLVAVPVLLIGAQAWAQTATPGAPAQTLPPGPWGYGPGRMGGWGPMGGDGYGWHGFWAGPLMMLLTLAALIWVVRMLLGLGRAHRHVDERLDAYASRSALRILNERFARGEIQADEFEHKKAVLLGGAGARDSGVPS